jgi:DNA-binding FrmR family transcriptional regulator
MGSHKAQHVTGHKTRHDENLDRLSRAEGQVRGIRRMVEEGAYCVDIVTQIQAAQAALGAIGARVLRKHVEHCVADAMRSGSEAEVDAKVDELMLVFDRYLKR